MDKVEKRAPARRSRRDFAKVVGVALAGSAMVPRSRASVPPEEAQVDTLARLAIQGTSVRLTDAELADLKKGIEENLKGLAKIRDFKVPADAEPAFIFRAK